MFVGGEVNLRRQNPPLPLYHKRSYDGKSYVFILLGVLLSHHTSVQSIVSRHGATIIEVDGLIVRHGYS